jgi:hypothetical protein
MKPIIKNRHNANYNGLGIVDLMTMNKVMFFITMHLIQSNHFWLAKKIMDIH